MANEKLTLGAKDENGHYITFSSFKAEGIEDRKAFFNAISAPESLKDIKGSIDLQHVYLEQVQYKNDEKDVEEKGETQDGIRLILLDKNMKGFKTSSIGVLNALIRMQTVMGEFPWEPAIPVKTTKKDTKGGQNIRILEFA